MHKISLSNGSWFVLKDSRYIHMYITLLGNTIEMNGFQNGEAVSWTKAEDDVVIDDDFKGLPIGLINHSVRGSFTLNLNDGSQANSLVYAAYYNQMTYKEGEIPTFGFKVVNDNNDETVNSPTCLVQKMPDGNVTNTIGPKTWNVYALEYNDAIALADIQEYLQNQGNYGQLAQATA